MIPINGTNQFADRRFSFHDWSAPVLQTPQELMDALHSLHLEGRIIKHIHANAAMIFNWGSDRIYEFLNSDYYELSYEEQIKLNDFTPYLKPYAWKHRSLQYGGPILIEFEDHDVLGVQFQAGSSVRMEMNTLPLDLCSKFPTFQPDTDLLFSPILGQRICGIDVQSTSIWPGFSEPYRLTLDEQPFYIGQFSFLCESTDLRDRRQYRLEWQYRDLDDDGYVVLTGEQDELLNAQEVLKIVRCSVSPKDLADECQFWKDEVEYDKSQQGENE